MPQTLGGQPSYPPKHRHSTNRPQPGSSPQYIPNRAVELLAPDLQPNQTRTYRCFPIFACAENNPASTGSNAIRVTNRSLTMSPLK